MTASQLDHDQPFISIESEEGWAAIMAAIGAQKIPENSVPTGVRVSDFVHPEWKLYFELKVLEKYTIEPSDFVPDETHDNAQEVSRVVRQRLQKTISSANDQIKSTKKHFANFSYQGVLILVNIGMTDVFTNVILDNLRRVIFSNDRFRSINAILFLTKSEEQVLENLSISQNLTIHRKSCTKSTSANLTAFMNKIADLLNYQKGSFVNSIEKKAMDAYQVRMAEQYSRKDDHDRL